MRGGAGSNLHFAQRALGVGVKPPLLTIDTHLAQRVRGFILVNSGRPVAQTLIIHKTKPTLVVTYRRAVRGQTSTIDWGGA